MKLLSTMLCLLCGLLSYAQSSSTHYQSAIRGSTTSGTLASSTNLSGATVSIWTEGHTQASSTYQNATVATANRAKSSGIKVITVHNTRLHVYPNPSSDLFNISTDLTDIEVVVRDATGKEVFRQSNNEPISSFNWEQGMYFITVTSGNTVATGRVLKM